MTIDVLEIIKFVIENYGLAGFALLFWMWHGWQLQKKVDQIQGSCNKMFGIMIALVDKRSRDDSSKNDNSGRLA